MSDNTNYWQEKTYLAVHILATSERSLRDRLEDAWTSSLMRLEYLDHVAPQFQERFRGIKIRFDKGIDQLSGSDQSALAGDIMSLFYNICVD
jgi:hypothetical protein